MGSSKQKASLLLVIALLAFFLWSAISASSVAAGGMVDKVNSYLKWVPSIATVVALAYLFWHSGQKSGSSFMSRARAVQ